MARWLKYSEGNFEYACGVARNIWGWGAKMLNITPTAPNKSTLHISLYFTSLHCTHFTHSLLCEQLQDNSCRTIG